MDPDGTIIVQKKSAGRGGPARCLLGNPAVRVAFVAGVVALSVSMLGGAMPDGELGRNTG